MKLTIVVASHGSNTWKQLAAERAAPSASRQQPHQLIVRHEPDGTVASARNNAAAEATGDWLVFVDADDELQDGYHDAIAAHTSSIRTSHGRTLPQPCLVTPAVTYRRGSRSSDPRVWPRIPLTDGNWLTIGTAVPKRLFDQAGGFADNIDLYEDWHLWARCWKLGAELREAPDAIYVAHVSQQSRNRRKHPAARLYWHQWIGHDVFPDLYEPTTPAEDARRMLTTTTLRRR